jgi:GNAT superfamily N-acetyltransferase
MLHVDLLWLAPAPRRSGCGSALLRRAEEFAVEHGCDVVYLSTFSFQAPGSYRKQGYEACRCDREPLQEHARTARLAVKAGALFS